MFHYRDGLFFVRLEDGFVEIRKLERSGDTEIVLLSVRIDPDGWASIVAAMSKGGEEHGRFYEAKKFHESEGEVKLLTS